ncbi:MAG TPA: xanthine dehydrogenase family protein molybdopterin-binding subunit [Stellaceae bacterium]|nr:xanthine dehydrogenase family protein molybdopterin-binding subunit [Stellaceae bacterium]
MLPRIGQPLDRVDGRLKVTGGARYAAEFPPSTVGAGLVHAVLVQSTIARGTITGFDLGAAKALPGVLAILTPDSTMPLPDVKPSSAVASIPMLRDRKVRYQGQHIAVVVADTLERAQDAASRVVVHYATEPAVTTMEDGLKGAYKPHSFANGRQPPDTSRGDFDGAFTGAAIKIDETYVTPIEHHNAMEPHATIAAWNGDRVTVYNATQSVSGTQQTVATCLGIAPRQVQVVADFIGGGFGSKGVTWPHVVLAAIAAREVGRPVKLVLTRAQMYSSNGYRPKTIQHVRLGADATGQLVAIGHDGLAQMSDPELGEFTETVGIASQMLYACPNVSVTHRVVPIAAPLPTFMRAPGEASGVYALESAMDELAVALKIDPLDLRLRNYAETDGHEGKPFSSKSLRDCYTKGAALFGWDKRPLTPGTLRSGDKLLGWGMATATYPMNRGQAEATVHVFANGSAVLRIGSQDIGTGTYTVLTQVVADALSLPPAAVRTELGDSRFPKAPGSGGSQTVASCAPAAQAAAQACRQKLIDMTLADGQSPFQGRGAEAIDFIDGNLVLKDQPTTRIAIGDVLKRAGTERIEATAGSRPGDEKQHYSMHSFGAQFVEVSVDPELGEVRVLRYVGAFAAGRILNAKTGRSQLIGGITYGIGMALLEETLVDRKTGRVTNPTLAEYLMPVHADIPDIQTIFIEEDDALVNALGVKGIGELPMVGVAAAIANAVYHATGRRVRDLPLRPEKVLGLTI